MPYAPGDRLGPQGATSTTAGACPSSTASVQAGRQAGRQAVAICSRVFLARAGPCAHRHGWRRTIGGRRQPAFAVFPLPSMGAQRPVHTSCSQRHQRQPHERATWNLGWGVRHGEAKHPRLAGAGVGNSTDCWRKESRPLDRPASSTLLLAWLAVQVPAFRGPQPGSEATAAAAQAPSYPMDDLGTQTPEVCNS